MKQKAAVILVILFGFLVIHGWYSHLQLPVFQTKVPGRFIKSSEADENLQKIMKLAYSGKIDNYLAEIMYLK